MSPVAAWLARAADVMRGRLSPFVLCYHGVGSVERAADPHGLFVDPELFRSHLDLIAERGYELLCVGDLARAMRAGSDGRGKGSVTFDDALASTARVGIPILLERGAPCTMFVATGLMGRPHPDLPGEMVMSAAEVAELAAAGVEIGAHSVDHLDLSRLGRADALEQMRRSRETLEELIGRPVPLMAYPYGAVADDTVIAAREAGYELACGCSGPGDWDPLRFPRDPIFPTVTPARLRLKIAGLYGPVHAIRKLQASIPVRRG